MVDLAGSSWVVTGAAGNIGAALRLALHERGVRLISTDLRYAQPVGSNDEVIIADIANLEPLVGLFDGADGVIHLGGLSDEADFRDLAEVNIVGTYHVLEAARRAAVPRVIYASSNRSTGMYPVTETVTTDMPPRPDGFYGVSKVAGEALCQLYTDKFGLSTIAIRIGSYEQRPNSAREQRTWLSPSDAVRAFIAAMTTDHDSAVFYAVSANENLWWDLGSGEAIGYYPEDDSASLGPTEPIDADAPQGGPYASAKYSLERMRD
ncbi:NAD(P)-dependent oxidoreductase [uncultured Agrococcus sp.]|uniref:NAD-dependent epimerase/dehydratase family protein n=1 Tax=uncultured Agrococcus sp. TaxID=382258 RepID=UPI0025D4FE50|nr:NAD(P)-dependent oxidoreductase [uncultured Agrococcus sp.]